MDIHFTIMNPDNSGNVLQILGIVIPSLITVTGFYVTNLITKKQLKNDAQHAKETALILIELLNNLDILITGLLYEGRYCPAIEHRMPVLSQNDGDGISKMSYAQRGHFFFMIGRKIIDSCNMIIFQTPEEDLPLTLSKVKEIKEFFVTKKPGQKNTLEKISMELQNAISGQVKNNECFQYHEKLSKLTADLQDLIEKELPQLRKK